MNIWLIISIIAAIFTVVMSIIGAIKSSEGAIGVMAHLSIGLFVLTIMAAFALPQYPGLSWQEIVALSIVFFVGGTMIYTNIQHNKILDKKVKEIVSKWTN